VLAKQFHLDGHQTQASLAAFLPAFALGMQHAMGTKPADAMVQNLFGGAYQNLWINAAQAFSPGSQRNGKQILDRIFGSDETSRRVAQQAAEVTGVNAEVMQQMLPVLAGIYAGGFYHWVAGQTRAMSKTPEPALQPTPSPDFAESWARMCAAWTGEPAPKPEPAATPFETMMTGFLQPTDKDRASSQNIPGDPAPDDKPPAWEEMMARGRDMQKQYLASLQSIFDEAEKASKKA
jgi:hypothetical protein